MKKIGLVPNYLKLGLYENSTITMKIWESDLLIDRHK